MRLFQQRLRPFSALLVVFVALGACAPPPAVYSRDPVDQAGTPFRDLVLVGLELDDHTRYELADGETLQIEAGVLVIRSSVRPDGSRRQRIFDLDELELLKVRYADGRTAWYPVATPSDLTEFAALPRLSRITMIGGEVIELDRDAQARWSASRLEILYGAPDVSDDAMRSLPLDQIESVRIADTKPLMATLSSAKFWIVAGAAAALAWFLAGREDSDNTAVE